MVTLHYRFLRQGTETKATNNSDTTLATKCITEFPVRGLKLFTYNMDD